VKRFRRRVGFAFIAVREEDKATKAARAPHHRTTGAADWADDDAQR
jgi:hypothetical protein